MHVRELMLENLIRIKLCTFLLCTNTESEIPRCTHAGDMISHQKSDTDEGETPAGLAGRIY